MCSQISILSYGYPPPPKKHANSVFYWLVYHINQIIVSSYLQNNLVGGIWLLYSLMDNDLTMISLGVNIVKGNIKILYETIRKAVI